MKIWLTVISTTLGFLLAINISYTNGFTQKDRSNSYSLLHARSVDSNNAEDLKQPHDEKNINVLASKRHKTTNDNEPSQKNHGKSKIASKDPQYDYDTDNEEASPASDAMKVVDNDTGQIDESNLKSGLSARKRGYDTDDYNPELSEQTIGALHENTLEDESGPIHAIDGPFDEENYKADTRPEGDPYESIPFTHDGGISPVTSLDDNHVSSTTRHTEHAVPFLTDASPSPSACLVHVPVTIHLKGTLAIRMKNCANCGDFTKNIESIGPLKVAPLNNDNNNNADIHQAEYSPEYEGEVRSTFHQKYDHNDLQSPTVYNQQISNILNYLAESDSIDFDKYILEKDKSKIEGSLEAEIPRFVSDTKKDTAATVSSTEKHETARTDDSDDKQSKKKHIILDKHIVLPSILIPEDAYKKGVIVSLPKGKAVLKCVSKNKDVRNYATKPLSHPLPSRFVKPKSDDNRSGFTSNDLSESNLQKAIVGELKNHVKPVPIPKKVDTPKHEVERFTAGELLHHFHNNDKLTEKFMKLFDKDMIVSLYRIAVNDIKGEMNHVGHKSTDDRIVRKKMELLGNERPILERRFPGFQDALDEEGDSEPLRYSKKRKRSIQFWNAGSQNLIRNRRFKLGSYIKRSLVPEETSKRSNLLKPQKIKTSRGTRRVKLVDTYRPLKTDKPNSKLNMKTWSEPHPKKDEQALSFYGEIDPNKLADPNCIEELCEKQKQFISHAGQYFQSLDNLAMEPYKDFLDDKGKPTQEGHPVTVKLGDGESPNSANVRRSVKLGVRIRQPEDVQTTSRKTVIEHDDGFDKERTRKTLVELYGKLPRIPLKITLNPKGPLAKLKKRIEIDLRPPNKGEPSSKAIVKTNDPDIGIHIANQLFIDDPPDKKMKTRLKKGYRQTKRDRVKRSHDRKKPKRKRRNCRKKRRKILKQGAFQKNKVVQSKVFRRHKTEGESDELPEGSFVQEDEGESFDEMSNKDHLTEESCFDKKSAENETNSIKASDVEIDDKITCENETNTRDETSSDMFEPRHPPLCIPADSALFKINANDDPVKHLINTSTVTQDPDNMVHLCSIGSNEEYLNSSYCTGLLQNRASINLNRHGVKDKKSYKKSHQTKVLNAQISSTKNTHSGKHYTKVRKISIKFMINELKLKKGKTNRTMKLSRSMPQPTISSQIISPFTARTIDPYSLKFPLDSAIIKHPIKDDPVQRIVNLSQGKNTRNTNLVSICNEYELNNKNRKNDSFACNKTDDSDKNETLSLTAVKKDDHGTMNNTEANKDVNKTETLSLAAAKRDDNGTIDKFEVDNDVNETETLSFATTETIDNGTVNNEKVNTNVNETRTLSFANVTKDDNGTMNKGEVDKHVNETETSSFGAAKENNNKTTIKALVNKPVTNVTMTNSSVENKPSNASTSKRFGVNNEIEHKNTTSNENNSLNFTDPSLTTHPNATNVTNAYDISNNVEDITVNKQNYKDNKDNKLIKIEIASDDWGRFADKPNNQTKGKSEEPNKLTINIKTKRKKGEKKKKEENTFFVSIDATKHNKKDTFDPYTDLGAEARRSEVEDSSNDTLLQRYRAATSDPYSTLGSLVSSKTNGKSPEATADHSKEVLSKRIEISGKTKNHSKHRHKKHKSVEKAYKKHDIDRSSSPSGVGAISLIRHTVSDIMKSYAEDKLSKQKDTNIDDRHEDNANARIVSDPNIKLDTDKPLSDTDKSAMLAAFPQFKEELSKISPETKKRLFMLKPFKFLSPLAKNESLEEEQPLHDPYADMGQVVEPKSRILSHENLHHSIRKEYRPVRRSETYDPYADMGTSIGLTQNEARAKVYDSNATINENTTSTETPNQENNTTGKVIQIEANIQVYDYNTTSNETQGKVTTEGQAQKKSHQVPEKEKAEETIRKNRPLASDEVLIIRDAVQSNIEKASNAVATTEEKGMNNLMSVAMNNSFFPKSGIEDKNIIPSSVHTPQFVAPVENGRDEKLEADKTISKYDSKMFHYVDEKAPELDETAGKKGKVHTLSHLIIESEPIMKEDLEGSDSDLIVSKSHNDLEDRSTVSNGEIDHEKKDKSHVSEIDDSKSDANANSNFFVTNEFMSAPEKNLNELSKQDLVLSSGVTKNDDYTFNSGPALRLDSSLLPIADNGEGNSVTTSQKESTNVKAGGKSDISSSDDEDSDEVKLAPEKSDISESDVKNDTIDLYEDKNYASPKNDEGKASMTKTAVEAEKDLYIIENLGKEIVQTKTGKNNVEVLQGKAGKEIVNKVGDAENEKGTIWLKKDVVSSNGKMIRNESSNSVKKDIVSSHSKRSKSVPSNVHSQIIHLDKKEIIRSSAFVREMKDLGYLLHQKMNHIQNPSHIVYYSNSGYMIKEVPKDGDVAERKIEDVSPKAYKCYQINTNKIIELMNEHYKRMGHTGNIWADPKEVGGNPESNTVKLCKRIPPTPTIENNNSASINIKNETALKDLKETALKDLKETALKELKETDLKDLKETGLKDLKETALKDLKDGITNTSTEKFKSPNDYMDDPYMQIGATVDQGTKKSVLLSPILLQELQKSQTQKKADLEKIADKMKSDRQFKDEVIGFIFEQLAKEEKEKKESEASNSPRPTSEGENTPQTVQQNNTLAPNKTENFMRDPYAELGTLIDVPNKKSTLSRIPQNEKRKTNTVSEYDPYLDIGSSIKKDTFSLQHSVTENAEKRRIP